MNSELHQARIRGLNTAWWQSGNTDPKAPIAILFHGFPDAPSTWDSQLPALEKDFLVVRPYLRGAGQSESSSDLRRYRKQSLLLDHLEILSQIDPERTRKVVVVGHDIGSVSAWELAAALEHRAAGLVVLAGMGLEMFWNRRYRAVQHLRSWYMYAMQVPTLAERIFTWFGPQVIDTAYAWGGLPKKDSRWTELQSAVPGMIPHYRAGLRDALDKSDTSRRLQCPVMWIWGKQDPYLSSISTDECKPFAKSVEIRILNAGHWPHQEKASMVNELFLRFFQKHLALPEVAA